MIANIAVKKRNKIPNVNIAQIFSLEIAKETLTINILKLKKRSNCFLLNFTNRSGHHIYKQTQIIFKRIEKLPTFLKVKGEYSDIAKIE